MGSSPGPWLQFTGSQTTKRPAAISLLLKLRGDRGKRYAHLYGDIGDTIGNDDNDKDDDDEHDHDNGYDCGAGDDGDVDDDDYDDDDDDDDDDDGDDDDDDDDNDEDNDEDDDVNDDGSGDDGHHHDHPHHHHGDVDDYNNHSYDDDVGYAGWLRLLNEHTVVGGRASGFRYRVAVEMVFVFYHVLNT